MPLSTAPDKQIADAQNSLDAKLNEMDAVAERFAAAATEMLVPWMRDRCTSQVRAEGQVTRNLDGQGRLGRLKGALDDLVGRPGAIRKRIAKNERAWWHMSPDLEHDGHGEMPRDLENAVRLATGLLGKLLHDHGYIQAAGHGSDWSSNLAGGGISLLGPVYRCRIEWTPEMRQLAAAYSTLIGEAKRLRKRVKDLERKKHEEAAMELWERA